MFGFGSLTFGTLFDVSLRVAFSGGEQYGSTTGADFKAIVDEAIRAIHNGVFPERIAQGSSGSYFVKNMQGVRLFLHAFALRFALFFFVLLEGFGDW